MLDAVGGYDATITRYGFEDIELGLRITESGARIAYLPEATAIHRAYVTNLERMVERLHEAGLAAHDLLQQTQSARLREYLRVDGPARLESEDASAGLIALRLSNRLLLKKPVRQFLSNRAMLALLRLKLRFFETIGPERAAHFGYHVARDLAYFCGFFQERGLR